MPEYVYRHPEKKDLFVEVFQKMSDEHIFVDKDGLKWQRVYTIPNMGVDTIPVIDPFSKKQFAKKTEKSGTIGDMLDLSAEMSERRIDKEGRDVVKEKYFANYEKENKVKHLSDNKKKIEKNGFVIDTSKNNKRK